MMSPLKVTAREHRSLRWRFLLLSVVLTALIGLSAAWTWTPLRHYLDVELIVTSLTRMGNTFGPAATMVGFAVAAAAAVPVTFLILVTILSFGPVTGFVYCLTGALMGAAVSYGLGRGLGHDVVRHLGGKRVNDISRRLADRGLWAVIAVRMVPIAPFAVINMIAGASHIRLRDLVLGTAIGILPSTLAIMLFADRIITALKRPGPLTIFLLALTLVLIALGISGLRRWLGNRDQG
ncbi:MAG: VTT domain-containing protein [Pseudomonadota bacterium]